MKYLENKLINDFNQGNITPGQLLIRSVDKLFIHGVKTAFECGLNGEVRDSAGAMIKFAFFNNNYEIVKLLFENKNQLPGGLPLVYYLDDYYPVMTSLKKDNFKLAKLLFDYGADTDGVSKKDLKLLKHSTHKNKLVNLIKKIFK